MKALTRKTTRTARIEHWHPYAWQAQSLLLAYPDEQFEQSLTLAGRVAATLPEPVAHPLLRFTAHAEQTATADLATAYAILDDRATARRRSAPTWPPPMWPPSTTANAAART